MNMNSFEKLNNLSDEINSSIQNISFGENINIVRVDNKDKFAELSDSGLGLDYRTKSENSDKFGSVFEGLSFDENKIRTQSYFLKDKEKVAAIITFAITPRKWANEQMYIRKKDSGIEICDFSTLNKENLEFIISPAWTKVDPEYLNKFAVPGFKLFKNVLEILENKSPQNTFLEITARGNYIKKGELQESLKEKGVVTFMSEDELPFKLDEIGVPSKGAESTAKMARLLNIPQLQDVATTSLGPVFIKKAKN